MPRRNRSKGRSTGQRSYYQDPVNRMEKVLAQPESKSIIIFDFENLDVKIRQMGVKLQYRQLIEKLTLQSGTSLVGVYFFIRSEQVEGCEGLMHVLRNTRSCQVRSVPHDNDGEKNRVDRLIISETPDLVKASLADTIIFCSGDIDFLDLLLRQQEAGKRVIVAGVGESLSGKYVENGIETWDIALMHTAAQPPGQRITDLRLKPIKHQPAS